MATVIVDEAVQTQLGKLTEPTEIRDASGKLLGYYTPAARSESLSYETAAAHFDPEELKRRKAAGKTGFSTPEVLDHLKELEARRATP